MGARLSSPERPPSQRLVGSRKREGLHPHPRDDDDGLSLLVREWRRFVAYPAAYVDAMDKLVDSWILCSTDRPRLVCYERALLCGVAPHQCVLCPGEPLDVSGPMPVVLPGAAPLLMGVHLLSCRGGHMTARLALTIQGRGAGVLDMQLGQTMPPIDRAHPLPLIGMPHGSIKLQNLSGSPALVLPVYCLVGPMLAWRLWHYPVISGSRVFVGRKHRLLTACPAGVLDGTVLTLPRLRRG